MNVPLGGEDVLARLSGTCFQPLDPLHMELLTPQLPYCLTNADTATLLAIHARRFRAFRREVLSQPFLRAHVLPHLPYETEVNPLYRAVAKRL